MDEKVLVAFIAVAGVIVSALVSAIVAWFSAIRAVKSEQAKRQSELALKISELVSSPDDEIRKPAMRRFAIGILKVTEPDNHPETGKVYFVPMNSRVTVGLDKDNDIRLDDEKKGHSLSRWHCGFISDQAKVWLDDYASYNGTFVDGQRISRAFLLTGNNEIAIGPFKLEFHYIRHNSILAQ